MTEKNHYYGWVSNSQGASQNAGGHASSIAEIAKRIRTEFGAGWTAHIMRAEINGEPTEVKTFVIRK